MKILITGFDAFNNNIINPSSLAVNSLPDKIKECIIIKETIPTVFDKSFEILKKLIDEHNPNIVICVGQFGGSNKINIERIAINIKDSSIPDNLGNMPSDEIIQKNGENAYFSTLPIKLIVKNIKEKKIPADISNTAGTFVCNSIMYNSLFYSKKSNKNYKTGFIHIPYIPEQVINLNSPSMSLNDIVKSLHIAIETSIDSFNII